MTTYKVGYFVGSLSSTSINRELAKALIRLAPEDLAFTEIPIGNLPLYSQDYDKDFPSEARALTEAIARNSREIFPGDGEVANESTRTFLTKFMAEFRTYIARALTVIPRT
jgi:hypothetical protein